MFCRILSKLIYSCLQHLLPSLISKEQNAFIGGRNIVDNIIVAQDLVNGFNSSSNVNNAILKLDISKAYDKMSWNFILDRLNRRNINPHLILLIKNTMSYCNFSVVINGIQSKTFEASRGIRQGDPLSPCLFLIAADYLTRGINKLLHANPLWKYKTNKTSDINTLSYADDTIIFINNNMDVLNGLQEFLKHYEVISGQVINSSKSSLVLSSKCDNTYASIFKSMFDFKIEYLPIFYPGIPLYCGHKKIAYFDRIIDNIERKVCGWFLKDLNHASRIELISSVLNSIPVYTLQVLKPPKKTIDRMEKIFNKFLWKSSQTHRKIHWSSWTNLCIPKKAGGIGIGNLDLIANSFQMKLWWILRSSSTLWTDHLLSKYGRGLHPLEFTGRIQDSHIWRSILQGRLLGEKFIFWALGQGLIKLWKDKWHPQGPFIDLIPNYNVEDFYCKEVWTDGQWDSNLLQAKGVPQTIWNLVGQIGFDTDREDQPFWMLSKGGRFTLKSAISSLQPNQPTLKRYSLIWNPILRPNISFFGLRLLKDWLPTDHRLRSKGIICSSCCQCKNGYEDNTYLFYYC